MVHMPNRDMHGVGFQGELELTNAAEEGRGPAGEGGGLEKCVSNKYLQLSSSFLSCPLSFYVHLFSCLPFFPLPSQKQCMCVLDTNG